MKLPFQVTDSKIVITDNGSECSQEEDDYWKIKVYPVEHVDLYGREDLGTWNVAVPRKQKPRFVCEIGTTTINPGKVATIRAEVEGYPNPTVEWFCNGKKLVTVISH